LTPALLRPKNQGTVPDHEISSESINRLIIDGDKVRFENNHPMWYTTEGHLVDTTCVYVFNGSTSKTCYWGMLKDGSAEGIIEPERTAGTMKSFVLFPFIATFRGLDASLSAFPYPNMKPAGVVIPINGETCREYVINLANNSSVSCFLDPKKDFVISRCRELWSGHVQRQHDIQYRQDPICGWIPSSWVCHEYSPTGELLITTKVEILDLRLNETQSANQYDMEFPPGCHLFDKTNGYQDFRGFKEYRVQADGSLLEIGPDGKPLSISLPQLGGAWLWRNKWLLGSLGVVLACFLLLYLRRRKRPTRR
jgi:hypothetical protein